MRPLLAIAALAASTALAAAEPKAIAIASDDPAFHAAAADVLAGAELRPTEAAGSPRLAEITRSSRALADRVQAQATVWLVFEGDGATLITYDREVDRALVRSLPYRSPLSMDRAAEIAQMTRTMLRALRVAADPGPPASKPQARVPPTAAATASAPRSPRVLALAIDTGVRLGGAGEDAAIAGRIGVVWRPDDLGVAATVQLAPAAELRGALAGEISDRSLAIAARRPWTSGRLELATSAGLAIHRIALDGMLAERAVRERALDPAIHAAVGVALRIAGTVSIGFTVSGDVLLRRQRYAAGAQEVIGVPRAQLGVAIAVIARML